jgi:hypothetical protein
MSVGTATQHGIDKLNRSNDFCTELEHLINKYSQEKEGGNTPDFLLAEYLRNCMRVFDQAVRARDRWYGHNEEPIDPDEKLEPAPHTLNWKDGGTALLVDTAAASVAVTGAPSREVSGSYKIIDGHTVHADECDGLDDDDAPGC